MEKMSVEVVENIEECPSEHYIRLRPERKLIFKAGQWIHVVVPGKGGNVKKPYSIASSPSENKIELCIKRVENGYVSNYLCDIKPGKNLEILGPFGLFCLKDNENDIILVATGTGIAPFHSMTKTLFEKGTKKNVWLFFGTRYESNILYRKYFENLARTHSNFHFICTLSRDENWKGERGYVQEKLKKFITDVKDKDVYICGLTKMVDAVKETCIEMGFDKKNIYFEHYV